MWPDLPMPVTTTLPGWARIRSTARISSPSSRQPASATEADSISIAARATASHSCLFSPDIGRHHHRTGRDRTSRYNRHMRTRGWLWLALGFLAASQLGAEIRSLTILHTNDLHARLTPLENGRGGFAALASLIRHERDRCTDCILLNAGDLAQGTPVSTIFQGQPVFDIANLFGFDAATLGNHDFDYGWMQTRRFLQTANYPIVSANMVDAEGNLFM